MYEKMFFLCSYSKNAYLNNKKKWDVEPMDTTEDTTEDRLENFYNAEEIRQMMAKM
jgi:hypothetical protein